MDDNLDGQDNALPTKPNKQEVQPNSENYNVDFQTKNTRDETKLDDKQEIKSNVENNNEEGKPEGEAQPRGDTGLVRDNNVEEKNGIIEKKQTSEEVSTI